MSTDPAIPTTSPSRLTVRSRRGVVAAVGIAALFAFVHLAVLQWILGRSMGETFVGAPLVGAATGLTIASLCQRRWFVVLAGGLVAVSGAVAATSWSAHAEKMARMSRDPGGHEYSEFFGPNAQIRDRLSGGLIRVTTGSGVPDRYWSSMPVLERVTPDILVDEVVPLVPVALAGLLALLPGVVQLLRSPQHSKA